MQFDKWLKISISYFISVYLPYDILILEVMRIACTVIDERGNSMRRLCDIPYLPNNVFRTDLPILIPHCPFYYFQSKMQAEINTNVLQINK